MQCEGNKLPVASSMHSHRPKSRAMQLRVILLLGLAVGVVSGSCAPRQVQLESASLVLEGCQVLTMATSEIQSDVSIVIAGDTIAAIGPDGSFDLPADTKRIACEGRYVLPGLTDMHVHIGHRSELSSYLLSGVTSVVNLGGDHVDLFSGERRSILALRDSVAAGQILGPTIYSAGQALDGDPATGPFQRALSSVGAAMAAVEQQYEAGFDFIKVYDALDVDRHRAIIDRANELGLAVFGHIPEAVGVERTLASGQAVVSHAEEFYPAIEETEDLEAAIANLVGQIQRSGVAVIPNGAFVNGLVLQLEDLEAQLSQPQVAYLAPAVRVWWEPKYNYYVNRDDPAGFLNQSRRRHAWIRRLVPALHEQSVPLLAGSDASIPVALPGPALQQELKELAASGLSNYEALRTATANVKSFMSAHRPWRGIFGTIAVGHRADLIMLDDNPLESLEALDALHGVVLRGQWLTRSTLWDLRDRETESFRSTSEAR